MSGAFESTSTWRAWLSLGRVSNLATCLTNVLVGVAVCLRDPASLGTWPWVDTIVCVAGVVALYLGGMVMNDVVDVRWDREHDNARPIATGAVSLRAARAVAFLLMLAGFLMLALHGTAALISASCLVGAIAAYNLFHKRHPAVTLLMGVCRGLVIVTVACVIGGDWPLFHGWVLAAAMTCYIVILTLAARREHMQRVTFHRALIVALSVLPVLPAFILAAAWPWITAGASVAFIIWTLHSAQQIHRQPPNVRGAIHGWLAGICLIDAWSLLLLGGWSMSLVALACFAVTLAAHRIVSGT